MIWDIKIKYSCLRKKVERKELECKFKVCQNKKQTSLSIDFGACFL